MSNIQERPPQLQFTDIGNIFNMSEEELGPPEELGRWKCCAAGCQGYTRVQHFGVFPVVRWRKKWVDLTVNVYYCSKHWPSANAAFKAGKQPPWSYKGHLQMADEFNYIIDVKPDNMPHEIVKIPVEPQELDRFKRWTDHYGMGLQILKNDLYVEVIYKDPINLYWLGGNFLSGRDTMAKAPGPEEGGDS